MILNPLFGPILAKGLLVLLTGYGHTPVGWTRLSVDAALLDRHAAHCRPQSCRGILLLFDRETGGDGIVLSPQGRITCQFVIDTQAWPCLTVSGCGLSASACSP